MTTKSMQSFDNLQSTGLDKIPKNGIVQIEKGISDLPLYFTLLSTQNTLANFTVLQFLANFPADWAIIGSNIKHSWEPATNVVTIEM